MKRLSLRPNVCMLVFNSQYKLFLGQRLGEPNIWQFPQGGVEKDLTVRENVERELLEELGLRKDKFKIRKKLMAKHTYLFSKPKRYGRKIYAGQDQTFWLVQFLGQDSDIDLEAHEPEFSAWRWSKPKQVLKVADPKRLPGYLKPLKEFEKWLEQEI